MSQCRTSHDGSTQSYTHPCYFHVKLAERSLCQFLSEQRRLRDSLPAEESSFSDPFCETGATDARA